MESVHEEWRPVVGREGEYEVSDQGRVRSLPHEMRHWCGRMIPLPGKLLTLTRHTGGYRFVAFRGGRWGTKHYVHRLVMEAFVRPSNPGEDVNHINGDKADNRLCNMEYCDRLHNVHHAIATGLQDNSGEGNGMHKLSAEQVIAAHAMVRGGVTHAEVAQKFGVSESCIKQITRGVRWKHLGLQAL